MCWWLEPSQLHPLPMRVFTSASSRCRWICNCQFLLLSMAVHLSFEARHGRHIWSFGQFEPKMVNSIPLFGCDSESQLYVRWVTLSGRFRINHATIKVQMQQFDVWSIIKHREKERRTKNRKTPRVVRQRRSCMCQSSTIVGMECSPCRSLSLSLSILWLMIRLCVCLCCVVLCCVLARSRIRIVIGQSANQSITQ